MNPVPVGSARLGRSERRVIGASVFGTVMEWYDFLLFGLASATVFSKLFFPTFDRTSGTLLSLGTFAIGFLARPIGGILFGHIGDRVGRKPVMFLTLILMGIGTTLIGLLPTYEQVGIAAPLSLVVLRLLQGIGAGGEFGGAILMLAEHAGRRRRGLLASLAQTGAPVGNLLATGALVGVGAMMPEREFLSWGWRLPFLLSVVLVGVGLYVRMGVAESPEFDRLRLNEGSPRSPLVELVRRHPKALLLALGARFGPDVVVYVFLTFILTYVVQYVGLSRQDGLIAVAIGSVGWMLAIPLAGYLSDRVGRKPVYLWGAAATLVWGFAFFPLLNTASVPLITLAAFVGLACHGVMFGPQASFLVELFPTRVRSSGVSVGYQLSGIYGGSLAPLISLALLAAFGTWVPIAVYMAATLIVTIVAVSLSPERFGDNLADIEADTGRRADERRELSVDRV